MGVAYNVPPLRTKELPYLDVLSESINNPLRLFLGWFALVPSKVPPLSLILAYWMVGAFFMATKRFAEYRHIGDPKARRSIGKSFGYYSENVAGEHVFLRDHVRAFLRHLYCPLSRRADFVGASWRRVFSPIT